MSLAIPSDRGCIVQWITNEPRPHSICLACGGALPPALERFASLRCHDCRDTAAPIRPELLALPLGKSTRAVVGLQAA